jgi:hypothetical protein
MYLSELPFAYGAPHRAGEPHRCGGKPPHNADARRSAVRPDYLAARNGPNDFSEIGNSDGKIPLFP